MVVLELVEWALDALVDLAGWDGLPVAALAVLLVGLWYAREASGVLIGIARWLRIGSLVFVGLAGLLVIGIATGALSLDSGIVARLLDALTALTGGSS